MIRIACALALAVALPAAAAAQPARLDRIERTLLPGATIVGEPTRFMSIEERMAHYHVPALSIAVIDGNRIVAARAYGSAAPGVPATPRTLFQAASVSKPLFAAAALGLVHGGRIALDRPINEYLRSWRLPDSQAGPASEVTLRRLLSHGAGLSTSGFPGYAAGTARPTLRQLLDGTPPANSDPVRILASPGAAWLYSGGGTSIAQLAVEDVTGGPLAEFMQSTILRDAGMTQSSYAQPLPQAIARAAAHAHDGEGRPIAGGWHIYPEQAAAGLWTNPTDLARFALWVMAGTEDPRAPGPQRTVAAFLLEPQAGLAPRGNQAMGLGFFLDGDGRSFRFSHGGSNEGFRAFLIGFPQAGQGAAIMVNGDAGYPLIQELLRAVALEYGWPERFHDMVVPARLGEAQLTPRAGIWRWGDSEGERVVFTVAEGSLSAQRGRDPAMRLVPLDAGNFMAPETGIRFGFEGDTLLIHLPNGPPITARRAGEAP